MVDAARARAAPGRSRSRCPRRGSGLPPAPAHCRSALRQWPCGASSKPNTRSARGDAHARRVHRHQHHRLPLVRGGLGIGHAHHDQDPAARVAGAGGPPLAAVEHVVVAVAHDRQAMLVASEEATSGSVIAKPSGSRRPAAASAIAAFCSAEAEVVQHFHVAGIGRRAIEDFRGDQRAAHAFGQARVLEVAQPGARRLGQEQVPQPGRLRAWPSASSSSGGIVQRRAGILVPRGELRLGRVDVRGHEFGQPGIECRGCVLTSGTRRSCRSSLKCCCSRERSRYRNQ